MSKCTHISDLQYCATLHRKLSAKNVQHLPASGEIRAERVAAATLLLWNGSKAPTCPTIHSSPTKVILFYLCTIITHLFSQNQICNGGKIEEWEQEGGSFKFLIFISGKFFTPIQVVSSSYFKKGKMWCSFFLVKMGRLFWAFIVKFYW